MRTQTAPVPLSLRRRVACVLPVTTGVAAVLWASSQDNDDYCGTVGECLGLAFNDLVALAIAVPLAAVMLRLLRVPRVILHTLLGLVLGGTLWFAGGELLRALDPDRSYDALLPLPLALAVGVLTGLATTYVVSAGGRGWARLAIPAAVLVVAFAAGAASTRATHNDRVEEIAAVPVTLYAPVVDGHSPSYGSGSEDRVRLSYSYERGADHVFLSVTLVPSPAGSLCNAPGVIAGPECDQTGDVMRDLDPTGFGQVGLVRGDTALVADFDSADLDPDDVLDALRDAPVAEADDLV